MIADGFRYPYLAKRRLCIFRLLKQSICTKSHERRAREDPASIVRRIRPKGSADCPHLLLQVKLGDSIQMGANDQAGFTATLDELGQHFPIATGQLDE